MAGATCSGRISAKRGSPEKSSRGFMDTDGHLGCDSGPAKRTCGGLTHFAVMVVRSGFFKRRFFRYSVEYNHTIDQSVANLTLHLMPQQRRVLALAHERCGDHSPARLR